MWPQVVVTLTRRRYAAQTIGNDGRPEVQTPTTTTITASWQPEGDGEQITTPGFSGPRKRKLFAFSEVRPVDESTGTPADEVVDGSAVYSVTAVHYWPALGLIAEHWEAICDLVQPLVPGPPE